MGNNISAAVYDRGMPAFTEGDLLLQFGDIMNAYGTEGDISTTEGFDKKNGWPPFRITHDIAKLPAALGKQSLKRGKAAEGQDRLILFGWIE